MKENTHMRCKNCIHFHRSYSWSIGLTEAELRECKDRAIPVRQDEIGFGGRKFFRRLTAVSDDGQCDKMVSSYETPTDAVHCRTTGGNQHNDGIAKPRVGEEFGCIHFKASE